MKIQMNKKYLEKINLLNKYIKKTIQKFKNKRTEKISENTNKFKNNNQKDEIKHKKYSRPGANKYYSNEKIKEHIKNLFMNKKQIAKSYYVLLFAMVVLGGASVYITSKVYNIFSKQDYQVYSSIDSDNKDSNVNDIQTVSSSVTIYSDTTSKKNDKTESTSQNDEKISTNTPTDSKVQTKINNTNTTKKNTTTVIPLSFAKPLDGEIIKPYSVNTVIYSKTLELWTIHDGLDISGEIGKDVKAMERGTIKKIYNDSFYGKVIIIDHGQGYESLYGNLDNEVNVKEKQTVKKGQIIGKIGNTAIGEIKDEPHIHIQLFKDNKSIDPSSKF